jgi:predicted enzyme related to lactoylglutathione lyase
MFVFLLLAALPGRAAGEPVTAPVLDEARFEQVALIASDLDAARVFYRDRLGLRLLFEANGMLFFDVGGTRLMIAGNVARERPTSPASVFYFHAADFNAALARLQASGAVLVGPVETVQTSASGALKLQQFEDPHGNMLAIMGFVPR